MDPAFLKQSASIVARPWQTSPYYEEAEKWTHIFWGQDTIFRQLFYRLDLRSTAELACGYGRHAANCAAKCGHLILVDVFDENIAQCRKRLANRGNVSFMRGNGYNFQPIGDNEVTAIYCYDAMVHFSPDLVGSYLKDAARILAPGGLALLHHSNHPTPPGVVHYGQNPHARNHMTHDLFQMLAHGAGLTIVENHPVAWGGITDLDRVSLLAKPRG